VTKIEDSLNAMVLRKQRELEEERIAKKLEKRKSLTQMERRIEKLLMEEAEVVLGLEVL